HDALSARDPAAGLRATPRAIRLEDAHQPHREGDAANAEQGPDRAHPAERLRGLGAGGGTRTRTARGHEILSLECLPFHHARACLRGYVIPRPCAIRAAGYL